MSHANTVVRRGLFTLAALLLLFAAQPAAAQTRVLAGNPAADVAVRNFHPSASPGGLFATESAGSMAHLQVGGGAVFHYATNTLRLKSPQLGEVVLVESQLVADALLSFGLFDWLELSLDVPVLLMNNAKALDNDLSGAGLGDVAIRSKFTLLDPELDALGLALYANLLTPSGSANSFSSGGSVAFRPGVIVSRPLIGGLGASLRAGVHLQEERKLADTTVGSAATYGAGLHYTVADESLVVGTELLGSADFGGASTPMEALVGIKLRSGSGIALELGGGTGLLRGVGSPDVRVFAGIRYVSPHPDQRVEETIDDLFSNVPYIPTQTDWDQMGEDALKPLRKMAKGKMKNQTVVDQRRAISALSAYPDDENKQLLQTLLQDKSIDTLTRRKVMLSLADGWGARQMPNGGCAQREEDKDILPQIGVFLQDPMEQERESAVHAVRQLRTMPARKVLEQHRQKETSPYLTAELDRALLTMHFAPNGCMDRDQDKIEDSKDLCPNEREDQDKNQDDDGCPELDNDGDGIEDTLDDCPNVAGVAYRKGCVDQDDDNDGLTDTDQCPDDAEDMDGFEDDDGCPDLDNDKDGIPDATDKCRNEPETINGYKDDDGCPDKGAVLVTVDLKIKQEVYFKRGSADIQKRSFKLLDGVAQILTGRPEITLVEVQGHTDDTGKAKVNLQLSRDRAESVRTYLIQAGIAPDRLSAKGYGSTLPEVPVEGLKGRALRTARERNRRVRFVIQKK
jgi:outer membrane protein OmpA-like peptidoglycan-associated protein